MIQALVLLPIVTASLRLAGFQKTYRWLDVPQTEGASSDGRTVDESVDVAARNLPLYKPTCLPRSLVLWHMLRRRGEPAELRIGVRAADGHFIAHAWVERDGVVVNDAPDIAQRFAPLELPVPQGKLS